MNKKDIWFVIVTYNPEIVVLRRLMEAVKGWPTEIVDNTDKNLGYGGGANKGMKRAFDAGAQWVIVLNQDVKLTKKGITHFCMTLLKSDPGIVGPEAGELDGKRWTTILNESGGHEYISGSFMAIHKEVWEETGGFWEPYIMYYEDVDICVRARRAGFGLKQVNIDGYRHGAYGSKETNENNEEKRRQKEYYLARNHLWFVLRLAPLPVKLYELIRLPKTMWETLWS